MCSALKKSALWCIGKGEVGVKGIRKPRNPPANTAEGRKFNFSQPMRSKMVLGLLLRKMSAPKFTSLSTMFS